jgi:hypothetical protein
MLEYETPDTYEQEPRKPLTRAHVYGLSSYSTWAGDHDI